MTTAPLHPLNVKEEDHGILPYQKDIPFMKYALVLNAISVITFVLAVFFLTTRGLHLSVEFTGGTVMQVAYEQPADVGKIREQVASLGYQDILVQNVGSADRVMIRLPLEKGVTTAQQGEKVMTALKAADPGVSLLRSEFVGPSVGEELVHGGLMALGAVVLGIVLYLAVRFEWKFGVAAAVANLHDVVIILGFLPSSSGSSRWPCWPGCWPCSGTPSTSRW